MTIQKRIDTLDANIGRRGFLKGVGGLTFAVALGANGVSLIRPALANTARRISAWVRIAPDNQITILTPGAEMGQGSMTGVPAILADEMDADWSRVTLDWAPADARMYGYTYHGHQAMAIVGSRAVMVYYNDMRRAGAQVRKVLLANAAQKWKVPVAELKTEPSVVIHGPTGRRMTYGEIAAFAKIPAQMPAVAKGDLKKKGAFRYIGKSIPRYDIPAKVNGTALYSIDVELPGMVYASTVHSPVQRGKPVSWNADKVKAMPGVLGLVELPTGVAVVADSMEKVLLARATLEVKWKVTAKAAGYNSEPALMEGYAKVAADPGARSAIIERKGDDKAAFAGAAKTYKASYRSDYAYHAQMEPLNAVARFNAAGDQVEIWEGTQAPASSRRAIAKALGLSPDQVIHHQCYMGGAFGRRSLTDYTIETAMIARQLRKPVKMIWTREEDLANGMFRPQAYLGMEAALDGSGKVVGWRQCVVGDGRNLLLSGIKIPYYRIPNQHMERRGTSHNIKLKHWRAVAHPFNLFAHEAFIDEMAAAEGMDPLAFRRQRMAMTPKVSAVFDKVAAMSGWDAPRLDGRAVGLSVSERSGSLGAGVVEISLDRRSGRIRVHKVWFAVDGGTVVQPEAARHNIESGILYGLSSVLKERATVRDGAVQQSNFNDYEVLRMAEAPEEIHVAFMDRDTKPTGLGEVGTPFVSAAVANAFYKLTGKRLYHMPFTPERVLQALKA